MVHARMVYMAARMAGGRNLCSGPFGVGWDLTLMSVVLAMSGGLSAYVVASRKRRRKPYREAAVIVEAVQDPVRAPAAPLHVFYLTIVCGDLSRASCSARLKSRIFEGPRIGATLRQ